MIIKENCRYFSGDIPCRFHKDKGVSCDRCDDYSKVETKILLIKLGAMGDVIRTTPLLHKLKEKYPHGEIYWLTYFPDVVPKSVDHILNFELKNIVYLQSSSFDLLINLDKDREACALAEQISADIKKGFILRNGKAAPIDDDARHKWLTGLSDDLNKANEKSYPEEIFEICGYEYNKEPYIFEVSDAYQWNINERRPLIGLNTGCGGRWTTRLWPTEYWIELARKLKAAGLGVVLLGGKYEDLNNQLISKESGATYLGFFPLDQFFSLVNECDLIVTSVSMALHIALGLHKKVVLFNNIFNRNEFEMYGCGEILEPDLTCLGCFKTKFDTACKASNCMKLISPLEVLAAAEKLL